MKPKVPEKPTLEGLEASWTARWERDGIYRFDRTRARDEIYSIDTPPPTVSGALHAGHLFSYVQTDIVARYHRMRGKEVFYPMGWDDNGLNVERRVQLHFGVTCDPSQPYVPDLEPPGEGTKRPLAVSRRNFIALCERLTLELEQAYQGLWTDAALSVDWTQTYTTIGDRARRTSQLAFLRLLERGLAYTAEAPTVWDIDFRTAIAQAELEDREIPGAYHRVAFARPGGEDPVLIETTRPELIPACVALVAHPDDARYRPLFGTEVITPLFRARVPVRAHALADPEKGSGIAMICTFGDMTDVTWWRELQLPVRGVLELDGRLRAVTWGEPGWESEDPAGAQAAYDQLAGLTVKKAQDQIVAQLRQSGDLVGEPRPVTHAVKFWENGRRALEIITNRQWFIRTMAHRDELLALGRQLRWYPDWMQVRYENWVNGLNGDWNITRQRFFGVPFPLWYPLGPDGVPDYERPIVPDRARLPVDPSSDVPEGYTEDQRDRPAGFTGDPNVMDTWATSSVTPQIVGGWAEDPDLFARVFPMDLRPQAHEIIRTWLFYSVVRSHFEHGVLPWREAAISGFVIDPDRKKLSKSKGNSPDDPVALIADYGSDAVRYWSANGRMGVDTAFDRNQFKIGRRLATKVLNVSCFVLPRLGTDGPDLGVTEPLDAAALVRLARVVEEATGAFDTYDYTRALERTESFFWELCDDYVELVKGRAYGTAGEAGAASASRALGAALSTLLRLFAPFLPFVTEEVWSWWQEGSIHRARWPDAAELRSLGGNGDPRVLEVTAAVLAQVRKAKSQAKLSMRAPVAHLSVRCDASQAALLGSALADLADAAGVVDGVGGVEVRVVTPEVGLPVAEVTLVE